MKLFEVMIVKEDFDEEKNEEKFEILFGPQLIFAYSPKDATKKACIECAITPNDINVVDFYIREFPREKYGE